MGEVNVADDPDNNDNVVYKDVAAKDDVSDDDLGSYDG